MGVWIYMHMYTHIHTHTLNQRWKVITGSLLLKLKSWGDLVHSPHLFGRKGNLTCYHIFVSKFLNFCIRISLIQVYFQKMLRVQYLLDTALIASKYLKPIYGYKYNNINYF